MFDEEKYKKLEKKFTEYKKTSEKIISEAEQLKFLVESSDDIISVHNSEGKYLYFYGTDKPGNFPEETTGKTPYDFFEKNVARKIVSQIKKTSKTGKKGKLEIKVLKEGKVFWFEENFFPVSKNGKIISIVKISRDITDKKNAEIKLKQQKDFFQKVVNSFAYPLYVINAETYEVEFTNDFALREKLPYGIKCFSHSREKINPCDKKDLTCPVTLLKYNDKPVISETSYIDCDGNERIFEIHGFPVKDKKGKLLKVIEYNVEITEKKKTERELRKAKEKAEENEKLKSAFLANMSHEIRTPLNGILGFADLLKSENIDDLKRKRFIDIINKSGEHLLKLINDIIDISKLDAGQIKINEHKFEIESVQKEFTETFMSIIKSEGKKIEFIFDCSGYKGSKFILTDSFRLKQILYNIIGNAVKFTSEGFVKITYFVNKRNMLEFRVSDTGIGMTGEETKHIFERFRQANKNTGKIYAGTGLGLSISKSLVDLLGGSIKVKSKKGKGSDFIFSLPYKPVYF